MSAPAPYQVEASYTGELWALPDALLFGIALALFWAVHASALALLCPKSTQIKSRRTRILLVSMRRAQKKLHPTQKKKKRPKTRWLTATVTAALDILWSVVAAAWAAVFFYRAHFGELRYYLFIMIGIGFALCHKTVGRYVTGAVTQLLALMGQTLSLVLTALSAPIYRLQKRLQKRKKQPKQGETIKRGKTMDTQKKQTKKPKKKISFFAKTAMFIFIIFCAVTIFQLSTQIVEREEEIRTVERQIAQYEAQIEALRVELATPIDYAYVRRVAKSKLGYSMPDDIIFFNDLSQ